MARINHDASVNEIIGSLNAKHGLTIRKKHFHDYNGNVTKVGRLEVYQPFKRNYVANPIVGNERANMQAFGNASHLAREFIEALRNNTQLEPAKQALLDAYKARFYRQLNGKPDPVAPLGKDGNYTVYARLDNFIRAVIRKEKPDL